MIQTVKEALYHNDQLDRANLALRIKRVSLTKKTATEGEKEKADDDGTIFKRLYFNRELLMIGYVPIKVGDTLEMTFGIDKGRFAEQ